jgi:hypothetical protein
MLIASPVSSWLSIGDRSDVTPGDWAEHDREKEAISSTAAGQIDWERDVGIGDERLLDWN